MGGKKKSKAGTYYEPMPLDFELLKMMPREGTMLGFHVLATTVKHALKTLNKAVPAEARLSAEHVASRLRSMHVAGYVAKTKVLGGAGSGHGWQRTLAGEKFYEEKMGEPLVDSSTELKMIEGGKS